MMIDNNTGFDPAVVAKFFAVMEEFRQEMRELRTEVKSINDRLADGAKNFALLDLRMRQQSEWQDRKQEECRQHQEQTRGLANKVQEQAIIIASVRELQSNLSTLHDEIQDFKSQVMGIGRLWRLLIALAAGMGTIIGTMLLFKSLL